MRGTLLFLIPIYFQSGKANSKRVKTEQQAMRDRLDRALVHRIPEFREARRQLEEPRIERFHIPWRYTQIIGFVEFRYVDDGIKADYWEAKGQRLRAQMANKVFEYRRPMGDVSMAPRGRSNEEIRTDIGNFIAELRRRFKKRYLDAESLESMLPYLDITSLLSDLHKADRTREK